MRRAKSGKIWTSNCPRGTADQNLGRVIPSQITWYKTTIWQCVTGLQAVRQYCRPYL